MAPQKKPAYITEKKTVSHNVKEAYERDQNHSSSPGEGGRHD